MIIWYEINTLCSTKHLFIMNLYKISSIVLAIAVVVLIYMNYSINSELEIAEAETDVAGDEELMTDYLDLVEVLRAGENVEEIQAGRIDSTTGQALSVAEAKAKMDEFKKWNKGIFGKKIIPYAFAFGKQRIRNMLVAIDSVNNSLPSSSEEGIAGVRVYLTRTKPDARSAYKKPYLDLLFVPVKYDGNDYPVTTVIKNTGSFASTNQPGTGSDLLLNNSKPCPPYCDGE